MADAISHTLRWRLPQTAHNFVLSEEGQESVLGQGFIPVKDEDR